MRKLSTLFLTVLLAMALAVPAATASVTVYVDNQQVQFDQQPFVDQQAKRTLVPFRQIFEALGAEVWYDEATHSAIGQKNGLTIQLPIDQAKALVNGKETALDTKSQIINGRTMVPLRFISENLGCTVTPEGNLNNLAIRISSGHIEPKRAQNLLHQQQSKISIDNNTQPDQQIYVSIIDYKINILKQQRTQMQNSYKLEIYKVETQLKQIKKTMEDEIEYFYKQSYLDSQREKAQIIERVGIQNYNENSQPMYDGNIRAIKERFEPYIEQCEYIIESYKQELNNNEDGFDERIDFFYYLRSKALNGQLNTEEIRFLTNQA